MKVAAGVLTYNHLSTGRAEMFTKTLLSLTEGGLPVEIVIVTNGSNDGTSDVVRQLGGIVDDGNSQIWYGMTRAIEECINRGADIVLFTADDIVYYDGWAEKLVAFWDDAPEEVKICSLILEPQYPWNTIRGTLDAGGMRAILRDSIGGCSWSFRAKDWPMIGPLPQVQPGEDIPVCNKLTNRGYFLAQIDLGTHEGVEISAWGNRSHEYAIPLDRKRWGL